MRITLPLTHISSIQECASYLFSFLLLPHTCRNHAFSVVGLGLAICGLIYLVLAVLFFSVYLGVGGGFVFAGLLIFYTCCTAGELVVCVLDR